MVHMSDLSWDVPGEQAMAQYHKGDVVKAKVLDVDVEKERISLGIKQLQGDPMETAGELRKGAVVTTEVLEVKESGLEVKIVDTDLTSFIRRAELARDRNDQRLRARLANSPTQLCVTTRCLPRACCGSASGA